MASPTRESKDKGYQSNMEVDYVICYRFATTGTMLNSTSLM